MPDSQARTQALLAGDIDLVADRQRRRDRRPRGATTASSSTRLEHPGEIETGYLLINNSPEVGGAPNPMADIRVRQALAHATNNEVLSRGPGRRACSRSPTGRSRRAGPGYLEDTGAPDLRPRGAPGARRGGRGRDRAPLRHRAQDDDRPVQPDDRRAAEGDVGGGRLRGRPSTRSRRASSSARPSPATSRSSPGATTPASTPTASSCGGRRRRRRASPSTSAASTTPRSTACSTRSAPNTDEAARTAAAEDLNRYFAEQVFNVWNSGSFWAMPTRTNVHNVGVAAHPRRARRRDRR